MIRRLTRLVFSVALAGWLMLGISGCQGLRAELPEGIVAQAVAFQVQADQAALAQQLTFQETSAPSLTIKSVDIDQVRRVKVAADLAYEVTGTYRASLRYPDRRRVPQSQVPFSVVLRDDNETGGWRVLRVNDPTARDRTWRWQAIAIEPT